VLIPFADSFQNRNSGGHASQLTSRLVQFLHPGLHCLHGRGQYCITWIHAGPQRCSCQTSGFRGLVDGLCHTRVQFEALRKA
jgi:hypothetical protein